MSQMPEGSARQYPPPSFVAEVQRAFQAQWGETSARQRLAEDLLQVLTANQELVQGGQGATWKDLPEMAAACLEAAGKIYPEPTPPAEGFAHLRGYPLGDVAVPGPRCGAVNGSLVCARHVGHPGSHASESGLVGWNEEHDGFVHTYPVGNPQVTSDVEEPSDSGAHPGVMLSNYEEVE